MVGAMPSCQQVQTQSPMSQASRDPSTSTSTMVAMPLSSTTQREALNLPSVKSDVRKEGLGYFKLWLQHRDVC